MAQYHTPPGDGLAPLIDTLKDLQTQLKDLQRPSGTSIGSLLQQVQAQVAVLNSLAPITTVSSTGLLAISDGTWASDNSLRPSIVIYPSTGRIRIGLSAITANIIGTFSMPGYVSRDTQISGNNIYGQMLYYGTASASLTREWIISGLTINMGYTITAEFYASNGNGFAAYPTITAENIG